MSDALSQLAAQKAAVNAMKDAVAAAVTAKSTAPTTLAGTAQSSPTPGKAVTAVGNAISNNKPTNTTDSAGSGGSSNSPPSSGSVVGSTTVPEYADGRLIDPYKLDLINSIGDRILMLAVNPDIFYNPNDYPSSYFPEKRLPSDDPDFFKRVKELHEKWAKQTNQFPNHKNLTEQEKAEQRYFYTPDEAAIAFAREYNQQSIQAQNTRGLGREWGAVIYEVWVYENGKCVDMYYTYSYPVTRGSPAGVDFTNVPNNTRYEEYVEVAQIHTHAAYHDGQIEGFSDDDIYGIMDRPKNMYGDGIITYVVTAFGDIYKATPDNNYGVDARGNRSFNDTPWRTSAETGVFVDPNTRGITPIKYDPSAQPFGK